MKDDEKTTIYLSKKCPKCGVLEAIPVFCQLYYTNIGKVILNDVVIYVCCECDYQPGFRELFEHGIKQALSEAQNAEFMEGFNDE